MLVLLAQTKRFLLVFALVAITMVPALNAQGQESHLCSSNHSCTTLQFLRGVPDRAEPSGFAPPPAGALTGFRRTFVDDFSETVLGREWSKFSGTPGGDPQAQWSPSHVIVAHGLLTLNAWRDYRDQNRWVTGGLCNCSTPQTYGAYFVRARVTGAGATFVGLLWPTSGWPPEIDFAETFGPVNSAMASVHFGSNNQALHQSVAVNMTKWHTWGVIWTPTSIIYTLDGIEWSSVSNRSIIPAIAMTLDLQQQTWCQAGFACPSVPRAVQIDWVETYQMLNASKRS